MFVMNLDAGILSTFRVDNARCMEALKAYDAACSAARGLRRGRSGRWPRCSRSSPGTRPRSRR